MKFAWMLGFGLIACGPVKGALEVSIDHPGSNTCANNFTQENVFIDDVELTTDASCPAP